MTRGDIPHTNAFANLHDVTLQRLDVYHRNNGRYVFYDAKHFAPTVDRWNTVPVVYVETGPGEPAEHPRFEDVVASTLPAKFRKVGDVSVARLTETGERVLKGAIVFSDPAIAAKANAGELSLSTGLASPEAPDPRLPGATRIAGPVTPNHILVFDRGACPNCYPNDSGAMFHNLRQEPKMDDESKGLLKTIADALTRREPAPVQHVNLTEFENLKKELETAKAQTAELVNLKQELETLKAEKATAEKDARWTTMKANLPAGWLGEKEGSTRKEFEADPGAFALKVVAFKNTQPQGQQAEGTGVTGGSGDAESAEEQKFANMAAEVAKATGIQFV
jgi:hypothetical protein